MSENSLLSEVDLQALHGVAGMHQEVTMSEALQHLSVLIQQQEGVEEQRKSMPALQVSLHMLGCLSHLSICSAMMAK